MQWQLYLLASAAINSVHANDSVDKALEHTSDIQYFNDTREVRQPHQMDEYDAALNLLIDVTPVGSHRSDSLRNFLNSAIADNVCIPDEGSCSPMDTCCQGGCSTSGQCTCQANNQWCFNYNGTDSFCCSNMCGANGRCKCIPKGKSCAVGGYCCSNLVCDIDSLICTDQATKARNEQPVSQPAKTPTAKEPSNKAIGSSANGCGEGESTVSVEIRTDRFGGDTGWFIADQDGHRHINIAKGSYGQYSHDKVILCLESGKKYNFTISDQYGDGICCAYGAGFVKVSIDDREVLHFKNFGRQVSETINVGFNPSTFMTKRHRQYLKEHNKRRKYWHELNNVTYAPLTWSPALAEESRTYAEKLLDACNTRGILHEPGVDFGENLAKNKGRGGWGQLYPVKKIVGRWVEWEVNRTYPSNGHLTQALWRSSKYMGCGESAKPHKGGMCRVQVCRYGRAGNCDMKRYVTTHGENWLPPMLSSTSQCGPHCPPEGCF